MSGEIYVSPGISLVPPPVEGPLASQILEQAREHPGAFFYANGAPMTARTFADVTAALPPLLATARSPARDGSGVGESLRTLGGAAGGGGSGGVPGIHSAPLPALGELVNAALAETSASAY